MIIDNRQVHILLWLKNLISTIIFVLLVFAVYLTSFFENLVRDFPKNGYIIIFGIIYIAILIYPNVLKYSYIYFSDTGGKITLNFYLFGFLAGKKQSIKIPVNELYDVKIQKTLGGIRKSIVLYRKMGNKVAIYPPVSITALNKEQRAKLINTLFRHKIKSD